MKRIFLIFLTLAFTLSLSACSENTAGETTVIATVEPAAAPAQTVAARDGVYTVTNTEELIAAIGPDRKIRLAEGTYDFSSADSYAQPTENPYCFWQETYDGFELVVQDVKNLTITGAGKNHVVLSAVPRYAQVLRLQNCENVSLTGFTAGHTKEPGYCVGGVLYLDGCADISIRDLGLYGCGVTGVYAQGCTNVSVANSDIYECSYNGVQVVNCLGVNVTNCRIYDLGKGEWEAGEVFSLDSSSDITISGCEISDNLTCTLVRSTGTDLVTLKNNVFRGNEVKSSAFGTFGSFVTLDGNTFEDCLIYRWFEDGCGAVDPEGNLITEDVMNGLIPAETVPDGPKTSVTVTNADEFLEAIAPNTEIVIDAEVIDFSTAAEYGGGPKKYYRWEDRFDGPGLVITGVNNLTIRSKDGKTGNHTINAVPRYANVLTFSGCKGIVLSGFTAGHTEEPGECMGGVLCFQNSEGISVDNCGLFGCGILGVQAENCTDITLRKCDIYECSYGGVQMVNVTGVTIEKCTFRDLGGNNLMFDGCSDVVADGEPLNGQYYNGR